MPQMKAVEAKGTGMRTLLLAAALLAAGGVAADAKQPKGADALPGRPETFEALVKCRSITEDAARLRCFDQAAAALQQATERRDVVIVDRAQVRQAKRSLFGIDLPHLPFFGGGDDKADEVTQIDGVIASAFQNGNGRWVVRLEDGGIWAQIDDNPISIWPKAGQKVVIKRAALGSYMMRINGQAGVRAKRQL
jgi:hypothetical protein